MNCAGCFDNPPFPLFLAGKHKRLRQQTCAFLWQRSLSATSGKYLGKKAMKFTWVHTHTHTHTPHTHLTLDSSGWLHIYHLNLFAVAFGCILRPSSFAALRLEYQRVTKSRLRIDAIYIYTAWYHTHTVCAGAAQRNFSIFHFVFYFAFSCYEKHCEAKLFLVYLQIKH